MIQNMGDSLMDSCEVSDQSTTHIPFNEISEFPQVLVTEKIIFCIDINLIFGCDSFSVLHRSIKSYINLKKCICVKDPEFECLLIFNSNMIQHYKINTIKDIEAALKGILNFENESEEGQLEIDKVFDKIASIVEIPDPKTYSKSLPPTWVYHVIWFFARNLYVPTMENTNPLDFLMLSPYFAIDILYIYNSSLQDNLCEDIRSFLLKLNENRMGYLLSARFDDWTKIFSSLTQFLGHPLMRSIQDKAEYNILNLGPQKTDALKFGECE